MTMPKIVTVKGIGPVTDQVLKFKTNAIHYWQGEDNNHNEKSVTLTSGGTPSADSTSVAFACGEKECNLFVDIKNSMSVGVPLFKDGTIQFTFDRSSEKWSMKAFKTTGLFWKNTDEWKFCSPATVVDQVLTILDHVEHGEVTDISVGNEPILMSGLFESFMTPIAASIKHSKNAMIQGASLYTTRNECTVVPISEQSGFDPYGSLPLD